MAVRKRQDTVEYFYFTIDDWTRKYSFGVNRFKWELSRGHHEERDEIYLSGRLRNKTRRKFTIGVAHLLPSYISREERDKLEPEKIGNAWMESGVLHCSAFLPDDAYYTLPTFLSENLFKEMRWRVNNLWYRKGQMDCLSLNPSFSEYEGKSRCYSTQAPALIDEAA